MRYIIRAGERGERASDIAIHLFVSKRRVEQVCAYHRVHGTVPSLAKPGRKSVPISEEESRTILDAYARYRVGATSYLEGRMRDHGIHNNHNHSEGVEEEWSSIRAS